MRTNQIIVSIFALVFSLTANVFAVDYLDFTGWDHSQVSGGGQVFTDILDDLDVTVESMGSFDGPSSGNANGFSSFHADPGSHSFRFTFSEPVNLVVDTLTVDSNELHKIFSSTSESYSHTSGADPTIALEGTGITITGNGFGISPTGAAYGTTTLGGQVTSLTLGYQALATPPNKYGQWRLGVTGVVPEPNSVALLVIGVLGMVLQLRKRS